MSGAFIVVALVGSQLAIGNAVAQADEHASVVRVIDGDTVDLKVDGNVKRVRLLNIDTPETVDPGKPVECLGPEASAYTESVLIPGTEVTLKFDGTRVDPYGRTLAAVVLSDGRNVSDLLAQRGLGAPVSYGHYRFLSTVQTASADAVSNRSGLFDPEVTCTAPGAESALAQEAGSALVVYTAGVSTAKLDQAAAQATKYLSLIKRLDPALQTSWRLYGSSQRQAISTSIDALRDRASAIAEAPVRRKLVVAAAKAAAAEKAHLLRAAAKAAAAKKAQALAAAHKAAAAARRAAEESQAASDSGGTDTYTGCRKYAPGGKTYTPIPCN